MARILIIDDDEYICKLLFRLVKELGHEPAFTLTLTDGLAQALAGDFDIVFLDVKMPDGSGLEAIPRIRKKSSCPEVIIITGDGSADGAEIAIRNGAWDYLQKPVSVNAIQLMLNRVVQYRECQAKTPTSPIVALKFKGIIGKCPKMLKCQDELARAASSDAAVLITGETGTGKEHFARAVHENSHRAAKNFVVVDCAALPKTLAESLLFGHEKGAFTGADTSKEGIIRQADGGTLFLDELGELDLNLQKVFLRALQERCYRPVGSNKEVKSDFRLVAVTNRNLDQMVAAGTFRQDLLYRIRAMAIELPPLRERLPDLKDLVRHHTAQICDRYSLETKGFTADFLDALAAYPWPGNIRELINTLEDAISEARTAPMLFANHLPTRLRIKLARAAVVNQPQTPLPAAEAHGNNTPNILPLLREVREATLAETEKNYFNELMAVTRGNIQEACRLSGLSRTQLYSLLKRHNISRSGR